MKNTNGKRPSPGPLRRLGGYVDRGLTSFFGAIARFVAVRPYTVLFVCIGIGLLCGAGIARIKVITAAEDLYTHQGTQGFKDRDYVQQLYGYQKITDYIYTTGPNEDESNILTQAALLSMLDFYNAFLNYSTVYNGETLSFESSSICDRPRGEGTPCNLVSVLDFWNYSRAAIVADTNLGLTVSNTSAVDRLGRALPAALVMGGITRDNSTNQITGVQAFQLSYTLQNNKKDGKSDTKDKIVDAWQKDVVPFVRNYQAAGIELFYNSNYAKEDESSKTITGDVSLLIIGYGLLIFYGMLVLSKRHPVESRAILALANIGSIALAVIGSYGLCILVGVGFSLVVQVLALLLLGLGTDDMLVTMSAHEETGLEMPNASIVERVVATVSRARRGVVVASLTTFIAFCTGASSTLPALRDFMIYAAVGVVLVVIFQSTFYVACITLDLRRQRANKLDIICCVRSKAGPEDGCCGSKFNNAAPSFSQTIIGIWLPRLILNPVGKIVVLAITTFLIVMGIIGAAKVTQNFDDDWFVPSGSFIEDVLAVRAKYFQLNGPGAIPFSVYTKNTVPPLDYFNYQDELLALSTQLQANSYVSTSPPVQSWYVSYVAWLKTSSYSANLTAQGRAPSSALFYTSLKEYLSSEGDRFLTDIVFSNNLTNVILSSSINAFFVTLDDSVKQVDGMDSVRGVAKTYGPNLQAFAYSFPFLFYEGYAVILWDTLKEIIIAGSVIFVILLLLLADITTSILVGLMVVLIDVELIGYIYWVGLYFNSVTSINMLLAIGIAVDYSAFTAFSFLTRVGTRNARAHEALRTFGVAVFNGGLTMFIAILPAAGAKSYIFQTFFKMFAMIVLLGLWHGLFTLPVLLSFIGSDAYESAYEREEKLANEKEAETRGQELSTSHAMDAPPVQSIES